ncbi:amino acid perminase [Candidatus Nitrosoglobus terrae]|uniref:Amino acid perminase n=1 Tax=Candidatus Nitrosoglobus terrae TaxID=1630141 RepID=A0A1Q2SKC8_9GAMM|nr:amino acid perminase [Candidatus Nitrosoglobus terrae]
MVAIGWSGYVQALMTQLTGLQLPIWLQRAWDSTQPDSGKRFNLAASLITLVMTWILTMKTVWGAWVNTRIVVIKIVGIVLVIIVGAFHINPDGSYLSP